MKKNDNNSVQLHWTQLLTPNIWMQPEQLILFGPGKICIATQMKKLQHKTQKMLPLQCSTPLQESNVSKKHEWVMVRACFGLFISASLEV